MQLWQKLETGARRVVLSTTEEHVDQSTWSRADCWRPDRYRNRSHLALGRLSAETPSLLTLARRLAQVYVGLHAAVAQENV